VVVKREVYTLACDFRGIAWSACGGSAFRIAAHLKVCGARLFSPGFDAPLAMLDEVDFDVFIPMTAPGQNAFLHI